MFCRTCLKKVFRPSTSISQISFDNDRKLLSIFPGMDPSLTQTVHICKQCLSDFNFVSRITKVLLEKEKTFRVVGDSNYRRCCKLCYGFTPSETIFINKNDLQQLFLGMIHFAFPQWKNLSSNLKICPSCRLLIEKIYSFKKRCYQTEEKLRLFRSKNDLSVLTDSDLNQFVEQQNSNGTKSSLEILRSGSNANLPLKSKKFEGVIYGNHSEDYNKGILIEKDVLDCSIKNEPGLQIEAAMVMIDDKIILNEIDDMVFEDDTVEDSDGDEFDEIAERNAMSINNIITISDDEENISENKEEYIQPNRISLSDCNLSKVDMKETDKNLIYCGTSQVIEMKNLIINGNIQNERKRNCSIESSIKMGTLEMKSNHPSPKCDMKTTKYIDYCREEALKINQNKSSTAFEPFENRYIGHYDEKTNNKEKEVQFKDNLLLWDEDCFEIVETYDKNEYIRIDEQPTEQIENSEPRNRSNLAKDELWGCYICIAKFKLRSKIRQHLFFHEDPHNKYGIFECGNCPFKASCKATVTRHKKLHKKTSISKVLGKKIFYLCQYCSNIYTSKGDIQSHVNEHIISCKKYQCVDCWFSTNTSKTLRLHYKLTSTAEEWIQVAQGYSNIWDFPHCLGAMDGKHIAIKQPTKSGAYYYNYKSYYSVVLFAIVNANYEFIYVHTGTNGRVSDGAVLQETDFYDKLENKQLNIPLPSNLIGSQHIAQFVFIGDEAFQLTENIMKPYRKTIGSPINEKIINYRLSRARRVVENAFGIMSCRFRILLSTITLTNVHNIDVIVLACCVLHNFLRRNSTSYITVRSVDYENSDHTVTNGEWRLEQHQLDGLQIRGRNSDDITKKVRQVFTDSFNNDGRVAFQYDRIVAHN